MIEEVVGKAAQMQQPVVVANGSSHDVDTTATRQAQKQKMDKQQHQPVPLHKVQKAADSINKALEIFNVERKFIVHQKSHQVVVKITDKRTGEVLLEIPPEEAIERYEKMQEFIGLLFNEKV